MKRYTLVVETKEEECNQSAILLHLTHHLATMEDFNFQESYLKALYIKECLPPPPSHLAPWILLLYFVACYILLTF